MSSTQSSSPADTTTAIVFTDVVNSSKLWNAEPEAMMVALEKLDRYIFGLCVRNGGTVIKTIGDSSMLTFPDLKTALHIAKTLQQHLTSKPVAIAKHTLQLRVGISVGAVKRHQMRVGTSDVFHVLPDVFGPPVNLASRAESSASLPGGIAVGFLAQDPAASAYRDLLQKQTPPFSVCSRLKPAKVSRKRRSGRLLNSTEIVKGFKKNEVEFFCTQ
ncbi:hypothetical protein HXX76_014103 [Chlamydomonas incerta]|uniref:Guanylate cyclase domain-containing protein n=1 Tax=Chlamydomonas incerta TaxID=51695 RepID=A0A835VRC9_CHLIN|nr:hypothetical protein HXX76_014103 [Chlamydomonas incerta]|eukprot:KAG2424945.1 hypothetical protein HXX76_014103 [Chlamydomonas incerta]